MVVLSGLALIANPLLETLLLALLKKKYDIDITQGQDAVLGMVLVVIGLFYHFAITSFFESGKHSDPARRQERAEHHDKELFSKSNAILSNVNVSEFLGVLAGDHSCREYDVECVTRYNDFLSDVENTFINPELRDTSELFLVSSRALTEFIGVRFFAYPDGQYGDNRRLCMQPELNIDRAGRVDPKTIEMYDQLSGELGGLVGNFRTNYSIFRLKIKDVLIL